MTVDTDQTGSLWFWQTVVTPHMAGLAAQMAEAGYEVTYVAGIEMSAARARQGWVRPDLGKAQLQIIGSPSRIPGLVDEASAGSIHICQGLRGNGLIGQAVKQLRKTGCRQWVIMEAIEDTGWHGILKRFGYRWLFRKWGAITEGFLAIGATTTDWMITQGAPSEKIFEFAYFLEKSTVAQRSIGHTPQRFRFVFVGQFIKRKRLDLLLHALNQVKNCEVELFVIGSGPLEDDWKAMAVEIGPCDVTWLGKLPITEVLKEIGMADCLVLPSRHDGWGAVISEALMVGTPVICSDTCGAAGVVRASGYGGVFASGHLASLTAHLQRSVDQGPISLTQRAKLAKWAACLGDTSGAKYLGSILDYREYGTVRPVVPWLNENWPC